MRNLSINLLLLITTVILFFGGIEVALRVTGLQTTKPNPPKIFQKSPHPDISYELIPNIKEKAYRSIISTNSLGFRGPEIDPQKPLIAVLGDSITFGYGLEDHETIPARLQNLLPEWSILNTAAPGYDLTVQTAIYREKLKSLEPHILILIFHPNDVEGIGVGFLDNDGIIRSQGWTPSAPQCDPIDHGLLGYLPGRCFLDIHSTFYKVVKKVVNSRFRQKQLIQMQEESKQHPEEDDITDVQIKSYADDLARLHQILPQSLPRLFIIWPDRRLHAIARPKIIQIVKKYGFEVLDLYDVFGNAAPTLSWDTVHPNAETAKRGAEEIWRFIQEHKLLPLPTGGD
ncbi:hypothetical protein HYZ98_04445 [Candidatus Peregrinibacteria bacterium]|nr:hypothetical protein [Candidatus Peregrinibacteria bacterium]